ncbi:hypothetical protein T01_2649 [Trichinella spiralis]|uniref:Uncharacterized protein n=1 Tax=Trichinella spiralis TaxID=6334 RepID=A0A0V1B0U0_TRISP|nr:hypothetical protein T01_2649 [Trichinella spiralis]
MMITWKLLTRAKLRRWWSYANSDAVALWKSRDSDAKYASTASCRNMNTCTYVGLVILLLCVTAEMKCCGSVLFTAGHVILKVCRQTGWILQLQQ